jgi:hypothetical protein
MDHHRLAEPAGADDGRDPQEEGSRHRAETARICANPEAEIPAASITFRQTSSRDRPRSHLHPMQDPNSPGFLPAAASPQWRERIACLLVGDELRTQLGLGEAMPDSCACAALARALLAPTCGTSDWRMPA